MPYNLRRCSAVVNNLLQKTEDVKNNESNGKVKKGENENNPMINPFYESEHGESSALKKKMRMRNIQ